MSTYSRPCGTLQPLPDGYRLGAGGETYLSFRYHLIRLRDFDARTYLRRHNPRAFALAAKMQYSRKELVRLKADFLRSVSGRGERGTTRRAAQARRFRLDVVPCLIPAV